MALQDLLRQAHARFQTSFATVNQALSQNQVFHDMALAQARAAFADRMNQIFTVDFQPIVKSAGSDAEKLLRLVSAFAQQRGAYLATFPNEVDQNAAQTQSVKALEQSFHDLLA